MVATPAVTLDPEAAALKYSVVAEVNLYPSQPSKYVLPTLESASVGPPCTVVFAPVPLFQTVLAITSVPPLEIPPVMVDVPPVIPVESRIVHNAEITKWSAGFATVISEDAPVLAISERSISSIHSGPNRCQADLP